MAIVGEDDGALMVSVAVLLAANLPIMAVPFEASKCS